MNDNTALVADKDVLVKPVTLPAPEVAFVQDEALIGQEAVAQDAQR